MTRPFLSNNNKKSWLGIIVLFDILFWAVFMFDNYLTLLKFYYKW